MSLKKCRECGTEVSSKASICPICGIKNPANHIPFWIQVTGVIIGGWFIATIIAAGAGKPDTPPVQPTAESSYEDNGKIFKTTAKQLYSDYEKNEVAADERMKGKIIEVTGTVKSIDKDISDSIVLVLVTDNSFDYAMMHLADDDMQKQLALKLEKGESVTVDCDKMMRIMDSPSGDNCKFRQPQLNSQSIFHSANGIPPLTDEILKAPASDTTNAHPPPLPHIHKHISAQAFASCIVLAGKTYQVPGGVLVGIMHAEGGKIGGESKPDDEGNYAIGPMQISSQLLPQLAQSWNIDIDTAHKWLRDDGCVNVSVAAWVLRQKINATGGLYAGITLYHFDTVKPDQVYADRVIKFMDENGLITHDVPVYHPDMNTSIARANLSPTPFPIFDVPAHCRDNGGSLCEYREQHSYDEAKGYWGVLNDNDRTQCTKRTIATYGEDSGFYSNLLECLRETRDRNAVLNNAQDMENHQFHY